MEYTSILAHCLECRFTKTAEQQVWIWRETPKIETPRAAETPSCKKLSSETETNAPKL